MLMAAARLDLASVFLYAGSIMPGRSATRTSRSSTRSRPSAPAPVGSSPARRSTRSSARSVRAREPAAACTPPTRWPPPPRRWGCRCRARPRRPPSTAAGKTGTPVARARPVVEPACAADITTRDIITRESLENAIAVVVALGGSTNAVLHLLAIAHEAHVHLETIEDFNRIADRRAAPGQREAFRPVRHERRPDRIRRRARRDEGAARRRPAARGLPDSDRQNHGREPRRHQPAGPGREDPARAQRPDPRHRRPVDPARVARPRGRRRQDRGLRPHGLRGQRPRVRR